MVTDSGITKLIELVPKSLDDIIRKNRNELKLEYVIPDELSTLNQPFKITNLKGTIEDAFLYKRIISGNEIEHIFLVGFMKLEDDRVAYHTSPLKLIDLENRAVLTNSGSHYMITNFSNHNPIQDLLIHICVVAHRDGWGEHFDVPHFFY